MRRPALIAALSLAAAAVSAPAAHAAPDDGPLRLGVVVVTAIGLDTYEADAISERLRQAIAEKLDVEVVPWAEMNAKLGGPVAEDCVAQPRCVQRVGRTIAAGELLFLALVGIGDGIQISVTWGDAATGSTAVRDPIRVDSAARERAIFTEAAPRLVPNAGPHREPLAPLGPEGPSANDTDLAPLPEPDLQPRRDSARGRHMTTGAWIAGGISLVALGAGGTFGALTLRADRQLEEAGCDEGPCSLPPSRVSNLRRLVNVTDALLATALVSGAIAGVLYWRSDSGGADADVAVSIAPLGVPLGAPTGASTGASAAGAVGAHVTVTGRF